MNVIYTLNQGGFLTDNARTSHQAAADRWGAEYVVLNEWPGTRKDTFGGKLELHLLAGDRCMWLDADTLIRGDCADLFGMVDDESFAAVSVNQEGLIDAEAEVMIDGIWKTINSQLGSLAFYDRESYFNGGLMIWTPAVHGWMWELLSAKVPQHPSPMVEQTAQNVGVAACGHNLQLLPQTLNRLGPATWNLTYRMTDYVHHWANWREYRGDKQKLIQQVRWQ